LTKIFYFSGTGNSLWSAGQIASAIGGECVLENIGPLSDAGEITVEAEAVVMVFPSYAFGLPRAVRRFAENAVFKTPYLAAFVTYGSSPGGTMASLSKILRRKNVGGIFFGRIPAVENYVAIFGTPKTETVGKRLAMQREATAEAARIVTERRVNRVNGFRPLSALVSRLFIFGLGFLHGKYKVGPECDGCGICGRMCPVSAISMSERDGNPLPVFSSGCEHCQGCLNWCPKKAIRFGRINPATAGYRHPEIGIGEMSR